MSNYKRAYASIDLDAIKHNIKELISVTPKKLMYAGVVKLDGYGHGAIPVARAIEPYVSFFCVATVDEAINLKRHHVKKPILILGPIPGDEYEEAVRLDIRFTVFTLEQANLLSLEAKKQNKNALIHIALDTGMNRIGLKPTKEDASLVKKISELENIEIEGLFTHLFSADESDKEYAIKQIKEFESFISFLAEYGINPKIKHVSNSAGIIENLGTDFDMVRVGIVLYGIRPSNEVDMSSLNIKPVMSLYSVVTHIKFIEEGETVSYGRTFTASKRTKVATIPIGYGDGYPRSLSNKGYVLIEGKKAKILGRVCMDQMMVDVTEIGAAAIGSKVTLVGKDKEETIRVEDLSALCTRFPYEFVCNITKRIPRIYLEKDKVVAVKDYFYDEYKGYA